MIISASRRTDIPSYYSDWFFRRLEAGFVCTRNPMNPKQVSRISLSPDVVDGIVFWTKNPTPMYSYSLSSGKHQSRDNLLPSLLQR